MSNRHPFRRGGDGTVSWPSNFAPETCPRSELSELSADLFLELINPDEIICDDHEDVSVNLTPVSPPQHSPVLPPTPPSLKEEVSPHETPADLLALVAEEPERAPAPESSNGNDGPRPLRGIKRRRSRHSPEPDYSQIIAEMNRKRKRTGQACDRCRVRRYKCDTDREGCLNCRSNNMECKVTDCVTGETYVRGAVGRMAAELEFLRARVAELEREKQELQREARPHYAVDTTSSGPRRVLDLGPTSCSNQQQAIAPWQDILSLQLENEMLRQQVEEVKMLLELSLPWLKPQKKSMP